MTWNSKGLVITARIVLGVILVVFGLNGFLNFMPGGFSGPAADFMGALMLGGVLPVVKAFEVVIGLMILTRRYPALATLMLVPLSVAYLVFHLSLAPAAGIPAYIVIVLNVYLVAVYKKAYMPMLTA